MHKTALALIILAFICVCCGPENSPKTVQKSENILAAKVQQLSQKYKLTDSAFDAECIYQAGDLRQVIVGILAELLPEESFEVSEVVAGTPRRYVATVVYQGKKLAELRADTHADFLPDDFYQSLEEIPVRMHSKRRFYTLHPYLLGQAVWYFCGDDDALRQAKREGLPLLLPEENLNDADLSAYE